MGPLARPAVNIQVVILTPPPPPSNLSEDLLPRLSRGCCDVEDTTSEVVTTLQLIHYFYYLKGAYVLGKKGYGTLS